MLLERAIGQFMLDLHTNEHGYTEINPPLLVRNDVMFGTGQLPKFEDDQFWAIKGELLSAPNADLRMVMKGAARLKDLAPDAICVADPLAFTGCGTLGGGLCESPVGSEYGAVDTAEALCRGAKLLGVVPKTYLPNYKEFYDARYFAPAFNATADTITLADGSRVLRIEASPLPSTDASTAR